MNPAPIDAAEAAFAAAAAKARVGDLAAAARLAERAARCAPVGSPLAMQLANLRGGIAFVRGNLPQAETWFEEAIRMARASGEAVVVAKASNNLASIAHLRGKNTLAVSLYRSALAGFRGTRDAAGEAQAAHNLGLVHRGLRQLALARRAAERAVMAARRHGGPDLLALALMGRAETALGLGRPGNARRDLRRALALVRACGDRLGQVEGCRLEALLALRAKRYEAALREAYRGYLLAQRLGSMQLTGECAELLARASIHLGRPRLAERYCRRASACYRALGAAGPLRRLEAGSTW